MRQTLITPQDAASLLTLAQIKQQCRIDVDITEDDALLHLYLGAAVEACQHELGRPILPQVWERTFEDPALRLVLHYDVLGVERVTAITRTAEIDLPSEDWLLRRGNQLIGCQGWPHGTLDIVVKYRCGSWPDAASVPDQIKSWLLLRVATAYANREAVAEGKLAELPRDFVAGLLDPWGVYR